MRPGRNVLEFINLHLRFWEKQMNEQSAQSELRDTMQDDLHFLLRNFHKTEDKDHWEMMYQTVSRLRSKYGIV